MRSTMTTRAVALTLAALAAGGTAACSSTGGSGPTNTSYTIWDPYPQFDDSSDWVKLLDDVRHRRRRHRQAHRLRHHRPDQQGAARRPAGQRPRRPDRRQPGHLHPRRGRCAHHDRRHEAGHLRDRRRTCSAPARAAARPTASRSARTPSRCTTTRPCSHAAGVDIASVKDWASLTAALAKVKAAGKKGITFSAIGTEEGSFQFLPWFWGSGAQPDQARLAGGRRRRCRCGPTGSSRATPRTRSSTTPRPPAGRSSPPASTPSPRTAPGSWPTPRRPASSTASSPIPAANGGTAPAPTGGEFVSVPGAEGHRPLRHLAEAGDLPDQRPTTRWPPTRRCPTSPRPRRCRPSRSPRTPS